MDTNITLQCVFDLLADAELQYQVSWYINDGLIMEETLAENISVGVLHEDQLTTLSYSDSVCCISFFFLCVFMVVFLHCSLVEVGFGFAEHFVYGKLKVGAVIQQC